MQMQRPTHHEKGIEEQQDIKTTLLILLRRVSDTM